MVDLYRAELARLERALAGPCPGLEAQRRMAPRPRPVERTLNPPPDCRWAAVLVLLYPHAGRLHLVLTRRTERVNAHQGQISFPGGQREPGESFQETALREAQEELGVDPAGVRLLGDLSPLYIPPTNYCVRPSVGLAEARPAFCPAAEEVAEVIEAPLAHFLDPAHRAEEEWLVRGEPAHVPFYRVGPHAVWGATAMILAELVTMLDGVKDG